MVCLIISVKCRRCFRGKFPNLMPMQHGLCVCPKHQIVAETPPVVGYSYSSFVLLSQNEHLKSLMFILSSGVYQVMINCRRSLADCSVTFTPSEFSSTNINSFMAVSMLSNEQQPCPSNGVLARSFDLYLWSIGSIMLIYQSFYTMSTVEIEEYEGLDSNQ